MNDDKIRNAALRSRTIFVEELDSNFNPECQQKPSPDFDRKMKKLQRRADHPLLYRSLYKIASIVLVLLISGGTWITVDAEARAAFLGWVKEIYETYFVYRIEDSDSSIPANSDYRPTWLPDGYTESIIDSTGSTVMIIYTNADNQMLTFRYTYSLDEVDWFVDVEQAQIKSTIVNGYSADILVAEDVDCANVIMWTIDDKCAFYISAFLSESELVQMAESVQQIK
ncbi:hypothetical protein B5E56_06170 [Flavonifractor sp. An112]|uniref:DUF4367 domain-containing protein n=1 Tax=Flavonifractor sp. An112 TaxID=1965544 RepID=UPI000B380619|nr:DUF4367 domain-containing protein [Flavonifractor sp. An112]OUQ60736.1 hypothetical protein B5E56_06170 [Flavonifractor sp. An112]